MRDSEVYDESVATLSSTLPSSLFAASPLASDGLVAIIWRMMDYGNTVSIYRTWTRQISCLHPLVGAVELSKHGCSVNTGPTEMYMLKIAC